MKPRFSPPTSQRGVALIIVLAMLVLLSGLLVAFMSTATTERGAAQAASNGERSRQIADSTINLVIGQLRDATSLVDPVTNKPKEKVTWASQPGAIRTYSGTMSSTTRPLPDKAFYNQYTPGTDDFVYKLYSSDRLKVTSLQYSSTDLPDEVSVIENWSTKPDSEFVDLNAPFLNKRLDLDTKGFTVEPHYPIIDPRAKYSANETSGGTPIVEGFDASVTKDAKLKLVDVAGTKSSNESVPYLPLPVKWLYVLQDGSIGEAKLGTEKNPIVGRTAFWVDDESCKLNINTASEGTFWDTPSLSAIQESGSVPDDSGNVGGGATILGLAASQPTRGEYQRYSGHPATTCLSPVLGWLWPNLNLSSGSYPNAPGYKEFKEAIYQISPFTPFGKPTSQGATWNPDVAAKLNAGFYTNVSATAGANNAVPNLDIRTKHLFASVDELMFQPKRTTGGATGTAVTNDKLTPAAVEKVRFFLTATSRAPEVNLFGRPKITLWPISANYDLRTRSDDLFAFASTIAKDPGNDEKKDKRFYLTRADPTSEVTDINDPQNKSMYNYLKWVTGDAGFVMPSYGSNFLSKYGTDRDQILTEIFDYGRTVNLIDTGAPSRAANKFAPVTPRFFKAGTAESDQAGNYTARNTRSYDWSAQVVPLRVGDTKGLGRFLTVSEAALLFFRSTDNGKIAAVGGNAVAMQAVLVLETATVMPGFPAIRPTYYTVVKATRPTFVTVKDTGNPVKTIQPRTDIGFSITPEFNICNVASHEVTDGRGFMPILGSSDSMHFFPEHKNPTHPTAFFDASGALDPDLDPDRNKDFTCSRKVFDYGKNTAYKRQSQGGDTVTRYPYVSKPFTIPGTGTFDLTLEGGAFDLEIWSGEAPDDSRRTLVQTIHLDFKSPGAQATSGVTMRGTGGPDASFSKRFDGSKGGWRNYLNDSDLIRSIEYTGGFTDGKAGDLRIAAASADVPATHFAAVGSIGSTDYASTKTKVHDLTVSHGDPLLANSGAAAGYLGGGTLAPPPGTNRGSKPAILPSFVKGVSRLDGGFGDYDRGLSKHMDGAFGNKVDEGNLNFNYADGRLGGRLPYYRGRGIEETGQSFFTPNRQLPSVGMIGSLPTGVKANKPWQTILLRPDREPGAGHPGAKTVPDHLWLDLFHVPVIEPYAISEPFSTAGKVNMNYVIAPFGYAKSKDAGNNPNTTNPKSYIRRDTALRGVMRSTFVMAVPTGEPEAAHLEDPVQDAGGKAFRYPIDLDKTLQEFEFRLNDQGTGVKTRDTTLFRSSSEICEIDLYPKGLSVNSDWNLFWKNNAQTGDNMRERPYVHIYPRLTTKSNVYTVHMRCQAIQKAPNSPAGAFDPDRDKLLGEYRGSATIERYIDPNDPSIISGYDVSQGKPDKVDPYYRYRVVGTKHFAPR